MAPSVSANSQTLNDLEQQKEQLQQEKNKINGDINDAEQEMQSLDSKREQLNNEISEIQNNIESIIAQIDEQEKEIARLEEEIEKLNKEIKALEEKIEARNQLLAEQARGVQVAGSPQDLVDIVLSADTLSDLVGRIEVINVLVKNNKNIMEEQIEDRKAV